MVSGTAGYDWMRASIRLGAAPIWLDADKLKKFRKSNA
jgi:hypothetical protein